MENQTLEQGVADALGIGNTETQTEPVQQTGDNTGVKNPSTENTTETVEDNKQPEQTQTTQQPETNGMKQLRTQYESTKQELDHKSQLLQRIADNMGLKLEDVEKKTQEDEDKKKATSNNIPIEVQRQIREQDEKIKQLEMQNLRANYDARISKLCAEHPLMENQIIEFAEKAKASGFNIFSPDLDLNLLYRAMNYDNIVDDLKKQIRQDILNEMQQGNQASTVSNRTNTGNKPESEMSNQEFMNELMKELGSR